MQKPVFDIDAEFQAAIQDQNAGRLDQAEARYHRVLNGNSNHADAYHNLGLIRMNQGWPGAALPYLLHCLNLKPQLAEGHNTLGNVYRGLSRLKDAEDSYRKALEFKPGLALAWYNLGLVLAATKRVMEAKEAYQKAIAADPRHRDAHINLGNLLRDEKRSEEGLALTRQALAIDPNSSLAHNNVGNFLRDLDRLDEAAACYQRSIEINPNYAIAMLNLGTVLAHLGRYAESADALRRTIALNPAGGEAYFQLAHAIKLPIDDPLIAAMRTHYDDPSTPDSERLFFGFALGRICDAHRLYDQAFGYWKVANKLRRSQLRFDMRTEKANFDFQKTRYSKEFLHTAPRSTVTDETPIFITGMIRSGTTLTEQILASHPDVVGADEVMWFRELGHTVKSFTTEELTRLGREYIARMRERFGKGPRFIIDKMLGNFAHVGLIHLALPNARIIRVFRNPYDSCLSAFSSYFVEYHAYCYDMTELAEYYLQHKDLVRHWDAVLPGKIYHQRYEDMIADPENQVRKLLAFCDLPFDERCLAFYENERRVRTASSQQVRERLHSRSVERWRNYEHHLQEWKARFGEQS